jgi:hypothetical protein
MLLLGCMVLFFNYYHVFTCLPNEAFSSAQYVEALERRLVRAETTVHLNTLLLDRLVRKMEAELNLKEQQVIKELLAHAEDEAVRVALQLAKHPAPPMPQTDWKDPLEDHAQVSKLVDDAFSRAVKQKQNDIALDVSLQESSVRCVCD